MQANTTTSTAQVRSRSFSRSAAQIERLGLRGARKTVTMGHGARWDLQWARRDARRPHADWSTRTTLDAAEWQHAHRGAAWSDASQATYDELSARSMRFDDCLRLQSYTMPCWLRLCLPGRRLAGYGSFVAMLIAAYRRGAAGCLLSYCEGMALTECRSQSTWRAWCEEWEALGLVSIVHTWRQDPTCKRPRVHDRLHYRIGPALERMALALLDGAEPGSIPLGAIRSAAARMRKRSQRCLRANKRELWSAQTHNRAFLAPEVAADYAPGEHSFNCSSIIEEHSPSSTGGVTNPTPPPVVGLISEGKAGSSTRAFPCGPTARPKPRFVPPAKSVVPTTQRPAASQQQRHAATPCPDRRASIAVPNGASAAKVEAAKEAPIYSDDTQSALDALLNKLAGGEACSVCRGTGHGQNWRGGSWDDCSACGGSGRKRR